MRGVLSEIEMTMCTRVPADPKRIRAMNAFTFQSIEGRVVARCRPLTPRDIRPIAIGPIDFEHLKA
ncbi:hypothetical protein ACVWW1_004601 [Bradyrhizobium sp. JR3.5]